MRLIFLLLMAISTAAVDAQEWSERIESDLELLGSLHEIRSLWLDPDVPDWRIGRLIDERIHAWQGPLPDGSFQWVLRSRPDSEIVDRSEHLVYGTQDRPALIEYGAPWVYGVRIVVPRKRSLFRGNNPVWIENIAVRTRDGSGMPGEEEIRVRRWFAPNTSQSWDFEAIVPRADVVLEAAAEGRHTGESLVEIHFLEAVEQDDPRGPHYGSIQSLRALDGNLSAETIDLEIERAERRLIPGARSVAVATLSRLLQDARVLIDSEDPEEQKKGRALLDDALDLIRGE